MSLSSSSRGRAHPPSSRSRVGGLKWAHHDSAPNEIQVLELKSANRTVPARRRERERGRENPLVQQFIPLCLAGYSDYLNAGHCDGGRKEGGGGQSVAAG